ncbi:MAG: linear amide C-N hydrolase [Spirochaetes bacterium]|nr:linear amide C-N hydrolase [Spirochaetota bacterium]
MFKRKSNLLVLILLLVLLTGKIFACTTFVIENKENYVYGRNLDWFTSKGHISVNKRNLIKTAFIADPEIPLSWVSKYGSVTFNQIGKEFPYGGMNEMGLVVEQMWLKETIYPERDQRFGLTELQWIQYVLDNFTSVNEIIASKNSIRISNQSTTTLHFLVADQSGKQAIIECINVKMIKKKKKNLPFPALANSSYTDSLEYLDTIDGNIKSLDLNGDPKSLDRFAGAALLAEKYAKKRDIIKYAFKILKKVSYTESTQWSIVYDFKNLSIHYKTMLNQAVRKINLEDIDFSHKSAPLYLQINHGTHESFLPYSSHENRALIEEVFNLTPFLAAIPPEARDYLAYYPDSIKTIDQ